MGTGMKAFIEYDRGLYDAQWQPGTTPLGPFGPGSDTYSLTEVGGLDDHGSKDYLFFGAIAGVRNATGIPPLFKPRGMPSNPSWQLAKFTKEWGYFDEPSGGWLTLSEINAALDHQHINRDHLSFETHTILAIMADLERRLGTDRVRLVFGFDG